MSFRQSVMLTTTITAEPKIKGLKESCLSRKILLEKIHNVQFQASYAMQGFKAKLLNSNKMCFIFISYASEQKFNIAGYYQRIKIGSYTFKTNSELPKIIQEFLYKTHESIIKNPQEQSNFMQKLFEDLNKKSEEILRRSNNQILAVQQIKSSNQYMKICSQIKQMTLQIKELCKLVNARKDKLQVKNQELIESLKSIEEKKMTIEEIQYNYQCYKQKIDNMEEIIERCIEKKKKQVEKNANFYDEHSFGRYLDALTSLKVVENQKKYLKKN